MKKIFLIVAVVLMVIFAGIRASSAGEVDILLQKLVDKGVITAGEAREISTETKEQAKKEVAAGKNEILPQWIQATKLKGDLRVRYQYDHLVGSSIDRNRGRVRMRLGLETKPNDKIQVGVGLATGLSDGSADAARSTNATFEKGFSKKPIALDYAYAKYMPTSEVSLIGGKMKNPLWEPGDLIWDTDINPEGGAVQLTKALDSNTKLFLNTAAFVIGESSSSNDDPLLSAVQPGVELSLTDKMTLKGAFSYYAFSNIKGLSLDGNAGSNTYTSGTTLRYGYDTVSPAVELSFKDPLKGLGVGFLDIPYLSFFGEYLENPQVNKNQSGQMVGFAFGKEKVSDWMDWQFKYNYARLEKDAIPDILPDSDRYGGKAGIKAHEGILTLGMGKNTSLGFDYYYGSKIAAQKAQAPAHVFQLDWNLKF